MAQYCWKLNNMKVGDLVQNLVNKRLGVVIEIDPAPNPDHDIFWVQWQGNVDWDMHFPEDVEVISESR